MSDEIFPRDWLTDLGRIHQQAFPPESPPQPLGWQRGIMTYIETGMDASGTPLIKFELPVAFDQGATHERYQCAQAVYLVRRNPFALLGEDVWDGPYVECFKTKARVRGNPGQTYCLYDTNEADIAVAHAGDPSFGLPLRAGAPKLNCRQVVAPGDGWIEIDTPGTVNMRTWFDESCSCLV